MNNRMILVGLSALTLVSALVGCGDETESEPSTASSSTEGGGASSASGNGGGGGGSGTTAGAECVQDDDCKNRMEPSCGEVRCQDGYCKEEVFTPVATCPSPDHDGSGPWEPDPAGGSCWGGQCCFTCIVDQGSDTSEFDPFDGPCVAGQSDDFCGVNGALCQNCAIQGKVCDDGECVDPDAK